MAGDKLGPPAPATRVGETVSITRTTREGRVLHYELKVLQQPERARACGSGPKSSADRRPVDPPPVVQMNVFEGPIRETATDCTFMYNADFFLFASLHHDTDSHNNRGSAQSSPPVLTGMPCSSMILLDRPDEAGYFIFSDLSVRHEGRYFLSFALMEEVKEERDKDPDELMSGSDEITGPEVGSSGRHYIFRTTVQTDVFDVFSAKKFPGLMESTALSRTVAEQGCRVRIRRDVRMRRREKNGKATKDVASREDQYTHKPRIEAPPHVRDRSSSHETNGAYNAELQRRQSGMEYGAPRPSFSMSDPARPAPYGPPPVYGPPAHSMPASPSYVPPPPSHVAPHSASRSYAPYTSEGPASRPYVPLAPPPHARENYTYRASVPMLAPKLEVDTDLHKPKEILPPIRAALHTGTNPTDVRRPSYTPQASSNLPRLLPQPALQKRDMTPPEPRQSAYHGMPNHTPALPPLAAAYSYTHPPTMSAVSSRKRTAEEAFPVMPNEPYRLQHGRREEEQPCDANYKMDVPTYRTAAQEADHIWHMSTPNYTRASDTHISVEFPALYTGRTA
ncbi:velvet factor-domain-containing protein [Coniella lustricola]|uniref:Velvet factor-domain-containing protein n=1 Tax=Coniella lustricola TaxID=2025994 RepID=A0A2T3AJ05_9PEZI|nr:velvet factor-domain-containing protein [Coniella lustricola]